MSWVQSCALVTFRHTAPQLSERGQVGVGKVCLQAPLCSGRGVPLHRTAGELHCSSLSPGSHQGLVRWQAMPVSLSSRSCRVGPRPQDHVPFGIGATTYFLCNFVCSSFQATHPPPPPPSWDLSENCAGTSGPAPHQGGVWYGSSLSPSP